MGGGKGPHDNTWVGVKERLQVMRKGPHDNTWVKGRDGLQVMFGRGGPGDTYERMEVLAYSTNGREWVGGGKA